MKQGLEEAGVLTAENKRLTAQQTWPFVAAAYSTQGTPRPCWFIIQLCDEIDQLIAYLRRAGNCGNGYYKKRLPALLSTLLELETLSDNGKKVALAFVAFVFCRQTIDAAAKAAASIVFGKG